MFTQKLWRHFVRDTERLRASAGKSRGRSGLRGQRLGAVVTERQNRVQ